MNKVKSGAQKRKQKRAEAEKTQKLPKIVDFLKKDEVQQGEEIAAAAAEPDEVNVHDEQPHAAESAETDPAPSTSSSKDTKRQETAENIAERHNFFSFHARSDIAEQTFWNFHPKQPDTNLFNGKHVYFRKGEPLR